MVRDGLSSEQKEGENSGSVESSATETAKTAQSKLSEGVQEVGDKGADVSQVAEEKGKEMEKES